MKQGGKVGRQPRARGVHHDFRGALSQDFSTCVSPFRTQFDQPVAGGEDIEVMLDHQDRVPRIRQRAQDSDQLVHLGAVEPHRRFVENKETPARLRGQLPRQLQPLGLPPPESVDADCPSVR